MLTITMTFTTDTDDLEEAEATLRRIARAVAPANPAAKPAAAAEQPAANDTAQHEPAMDYADVRAAVIRAGAEHGREYVVTRLAAFGVRSAEELREEQWGDLLEALRTGEVA